VLEIGGEALVISHDALAEGLHFLPGQDPADLAWKLVATNLSDLAAKGAEPLGVLLGYQLGEHDARLVERRALHQANDRREPRRFADRVHADEERTFDIDRASGYGPTGPPGHRPPLAGPPPFRRRTHAPRASPTSGGSAR